MLFIVYTVYLDDRITWSSITPFSYTKSFFDREIRRRRLKGRPPTSVGGGGVYKIISGYRSGQLYYSTTTFLISSEYYKFARDYF